MKFVWKNKRDLYGKNKRDLYGKIREIGMRKRDICIAKNKRFVW